MVSARIKYVHSALNCERHGGQTNPTKLRTFGSPLEFPIALSSLRLFPRSLVAYFQNRKHLLACTSGSDSYGTSRLHLTPIPPLALSLGEHLSYLITGFSRCAVLVSRWKPLLKCMNIHRHHDCNDLTPKQWFQCFYDIVGSCSSGSTLPVNIGACAPRVQMPL